MPGAKSKAHRRKSRKPYKHTGGTKKVKGSLRGGSFSAAYVKPLVHRNIVDHPGRLWTQPMGAGLQTFEVLTPERTWGEYGRGFDICQVTSNAVRSRNVTFNVGVQFPKNAAAAQPFQFRVITAWVKCPIVGLTLASTAGLSGMFDGQVVQFNPDTAWALHARQVMADSIGVVNGTGTITGNISGDRIRVVSDNTMTIAPAVTHTPVGQPPEYVFPAWRKTINFATNKNMRLYPTTTQAAVDQATLKMCPVNNPGLWMPAVYLCILNGGDYMGAIDRPGVSVVESHYWTDL